MSAEELFIKCKDCEGSGIVVGSEAILSCCGRFDEHGNCCNHPIPEQIQSQEQCNRCRATGFEQVNPLEYSQTQSYTFPTDEEIEKHYKTMWEQKPVGTITEFGFVAGAKWLKQETLKRSNESQAKEGESEFKERILSLELFIMSIPQKINELTGLELNNQIREVLNPKHKTDNK